MVRLERTTVVLQTTALPVKLQIHNLVDNVGLEPTTFCVQNRRSPSELIAHIFGAECRNRTYYLLITSQLL